MFPLTFPLLHQLSALWALGVDALGWMDGKETGSTAPAINLRICKRGHREKSKRDQSADRETTIKGRTENTSPHHSSMGSDACK